MQQDQTADLEVRGRSAKDITAGAFLALIGTAGLYLNRDYELGSADQMGPGYMPMLVLGLLGLLGLAVFLSGLRGTSNPLERWAWKELVLVLGAMAAFGFLIEPVGLACSVAAVVVISGLADQNQTLRSIAGLTAALVTICWLVFILGLGLNVSFLPPALGMN